MLRNAVQPNRRQTERHLSLLKDGRGAKEEDNKSMSRLRHPAVNYLTGAKLLIRAVKLQK